MHCVTCATPLTMASPGGPAVACPNCGTVNGGDSAAAPPARPAQVRSDSRGWAIAAHLSGLGVGLLSAASLGFVGPLVIWLLRKDDDVFVEHHAKEALNFQLTVLVVLIASVLLAIPAVIVGVLTLGVGLIVMALVALAAAVLWFVLPIVATVKAGNDEGYRYPFTVRFIR